MNDDPNYFRDNYQELLRMSNLQAAAQRMEEHRYRILSGAFRHAEQARLFLAEILSYAPDPATEELDQNLFKRMDHLRNEISMAKSTASRYLNHIPKIDD